MRQGSEGMAGKVRNRLVRRGAIWQARRPEVEPGQDKRGLADMAGKVRQSGFRSDEAWQARQSWAKPGFVHHGWVGPRPERFT